MGNALLKCEKCEQYKISYTIQEHETSIKESNTKKVFRYIIYNSKFKKKCTTYMCSNGHTFIKETKYK
jgi:hypothetical protein